MITPPPIAVLLDEQGRVDDRAARLATELGIGLLDATGAGPDGLPPTAGLLLAFAVDHLEVRWPGRDRKPLWVDLQADAIVRRGGSRQHHPLARAVGRDQPLADVLDATAGLGRDASVLANLGYQVTCLERSPVLHALLADGLARAAARGARVAQRLRLVTSPTDARRYLPELSGRGAQWQPAVVYLDPMFGTRRKSALVKKEMQLFHELLGESEPDTVELFQAARAAARQRVVVKRPAKAPPVSEDPSFQVRGSRVRWDVYLA